MRVLSINPNDEAVIVDALDSVQESFRNMLKDPCNEEEVTEFENEVKYLDELKDKVKSLELQELAERCMSFFWDRLIDGGADDWPEIEMLEEDMGLEESELVELFHKAGYTEE